jgi:GrpB-like predicted nucleotidyltransferase (UPF0157 family)
MTSPALAHDADPRAGSATDRPLGLVRGTVRLVAYDARWPGLFASEAQRLRGSLATLAIAVEHVGSTSVPGLESKPVIDILLGIPKLRAPIELYDALAALGYVHRPLDPVPGRLYFPMDDAKGLRVYHVSACEAGSAFWREHVVFRNRLRADPRLAEAYAALKRTLAARHRRDRLAYTDGKGAFVASVLAGESPCPDFAS